MKRTLDDVLRVHDPFRALQEVQDGVIRQLELRIQRLRRPETHPAELLLLELLVHHDDARPAVVLASPPRAAAHLRVLSGREQTHLRAVELLRGREHDRLRGHVQPHRERLRGEETLHERLAEENLDELLHDGQQPAVMDADALLEQRQNLRHRV
eukprot:29192-Pelagococcus_subviridis.AAC.1